MTPSRVFAALVAVIVSVDTAHAETLADFGVCALTPQPKLAGETVHAVIPARFATPGIWVTRTLLLVGVDAQKTVQDVLELKLTDDVPPREAGVTCGKDRLTIRTAKKKLIYTWTGSALRKR
jgi:hypothetical protein